MAQSQKKNWQYSIGCIVLGFAMGMLMTHIHRKHFAPHAKKDMKPAKNMASLPQPTIVTNQKITPTLAANSIAIKVQKGDSLAKIFHKNKISGRDLILLLENKNSQGLTKLRPGDSLTLKTDTQNRLIQLLTPLNLHTNLVFTRGDKAFDFQKEPRQLPFVWQSRDITIVPHINSVLKEDGITHKQWHAAAQIFAAHIDFSKNLHAGDQVHLLYKQYMGDHESYTGPIEMAQLISPKKTWTAIRFERKPDQFAYYNKEGKSWQLAFLRVPVKYVYISSPFSLHRMHPILHVIRPHYGVDLAANMGTPIKATGNGVIQFMGYERGYGNMVKIKHGLEYQTVYAHMSRFKAGLHKSSRVKQGQVIGYVGESGMATGPHVHYEFRIMGTPKNPMTVKLPEGKPLNKKDMGPFQKQEDTLLAAWQPGYKNLAMAQPKTKQHG